MIEVNCYDTDKDFKFTATDIQTGKILQFTLRDLIFSDQTRDKLHEEMQLDLISILDND